MKASDGIAMMVGVHRAETPWSFCGGLVPPATPFDEQAVAEVPEQAHPAHCLGPAHPAQVLPVRDDQPLIQAGFDAQAARLLASRWAALGQ